MQENTYKPVILSRECKCHPEPHTQQSWVWGEGSALDSSPRPKGGAQNDTEMGAHDADHPRHHCGIFGIYGHPEASRLIYLGLFALQHRGEESAGIVTSDGAQVYSHKGMGLVGDIFNEENLTLLKGHLGIGHVRYSTSGSSMLKNAQPILVDCSRGSVAVAHNGNLVNAQILRDELEAYGSIFQTTTDSEIIVHLVARPSAKSLEESLVETLRKISGAFSLVLSTEDSVIGVRDPMGFRPLVLGKLGGAHVLASETCALDLIDAEFVREVEPGEVVFLSKRGVRSIKPLTPDVRHAHCLFEFVYFARPDSRIFGDQVEKVREKLGRQLAREYPADADIVMAIPDSGNAAALGYSLESGIPFSIGMIRNHYVGRTFIKPTQNQRDFQARVKFNPVREVLKGKRVVVIDDSIVRGTTCKARIKTLREAGASEIHLRISCPPIVSPCLYGIDFPSSKELIAANKSVEEIRKFLGVDSLGYLSIEGMLSCVSHPKDSFCSACWSKRYPIPFPGELDKLSAERKRCQ